METKPKILSAHELLAGEGRHECPVVITRFLTRFGKVEWFVWVGVGPQPQRIWWRGDLAGAKKVMRQALGR